MHAPLHAAGAMPWPFACPICRDPLAVEGGEARCARCDRTYVCSAEIWRFLPDARLARYQRFLREYRAVREDEGWGRPDAAYFLALPNVSPDDPHRAVWRRRARSYRRLLDTAVEPASGRLRRPLRLLDIGAGNCWLAYRLAAAGHLVAAIDLSVDPLDGLSAHRWYRAELERASAPPFTPIQAELDRLPLAAGAADLAVFNASLHYSADCVATLREALRVLTPDGAIVVMDSPVYRHAGSGEQMRAELHQKYGLSAGGIPSEGFLTTGRLRDLAVELSIRWRFHRPGRLNRVRGPWRRMRGRRELASMPVIVGGRV